MNIDLMFPCNVPFHCRNGTDKEIEITQDEEGRFRVKEYLVAICTHCGSAEYGNCGIRIDEKPYIPYFKRIVVEKGGKVLPTQPTSNQPCYECGRSGKTIFVFSKTIFVRHLSIRILFCSVCLLLSAVDPRFVLEPAGFLLFVVFVILPHTGRVLGTIFDQQFVFLCYGMEGNAPMSS